jgi:hypothetical protein
MCDWHTLRKKVNEVFLYFLIPVHLFKECQRCFPLFSYMIVTRMIVPFFLLFLFLFLYFINLYIYIYIYTQIHNIHIYIYIYIQIPIYFFLLLSLSKQLRKKSLLITCIHVGRLKSNTSLDFTTPLWAYGYVHACDY